MSFTVALGWWTVPAAITAACVMGAHFFARGDGRPDPYGGGAIIGIMAYSAALIASLTSWLIWALLG